MIPKFDHNVFSSVVKSHLCSSSPVNTATDKKLLIVIDTNILMNHLKFVKILKTTEIPGIYKNSQMLIFFFELIFCINSCFFSQLYYVIWIF